MKPLLLKKQLKRLKNLKKLSKRNLKRLKVAGYESTLQFFYVQVLTVICNIDAPLIIIFTFKLKIYKWNCSITYSVE
jgi:hypothetical protein